MKCIHKRVETDTELKHSSNNKIRSLNSRRSIRTEEREHIKEKSENTNEMKLLTTISSNVTSHA